MNAKSKWACIFSVQRLVKDGWAYLWTLTTPEVVDLKELSDRWRKLISNGFPPCVRVFEKHPKGHGYHVHFVTAKRIDVAQLRLRTAQVGFGRIHAKRIPGKKGRYIAKYLTKQRGTPGVRLWACVGFKGIRVSSIRIYDSRWEEMKKIMQKFPSPNGYNFYARITRAREMRDRLLWDAMKHGAEPGYKPPFPELYRHWVASPLYSIGKPNCRIPTVQEVLDYTNAKLSPQKQTPPCDQTLPLPLEN